MKRRTLAASAAVALTAGTLATAVVTSSPASATTDECMNTPQPVSGPVGCGTLYLPHTGYPHAGNAMALTASHDQFMAPVKAEPLGASGMQDWMTYQVCTRITADRGPSLPCGSGGQLVPGRVVLRLAPDGEQQDVNSQRSLCLDDNHQHVQLGNCQGYRTLFTEGFPGNGLSDGTPPVVENPIAAETWTVARNVDGVSLRNIYTGWYLDDNAGGGPGTELITWSWNGSNDQKWRFAGCTAGAGTQVNAYCY
jgi:hypothetical protein